MFVLIHMATQLLISLIQGQRETNSFLRKKHHWAHIANMFIYKTLKPLISTSFFKILKNLLCKSMDWFLYKRASIMKELIILIAKILVTE